jgi:hypothetical protein
MAAAQFFSVFLRCEADQRLGRVGGAMKWMPVVVAVGVEKMAADAVP